MPPPRYCTTKPKELAWEEFTTRNSRSASTFVPLAKGLTELGTAFTRYSFSSRSLHENQYYYSQTPPAAPFPQDSEIAPCSKRNRSRTQTYDRNNTRNDHTKNRPHLTTIEGALAGAATDLATTAATLLSVPPAACSAAAATPIER